ncbi:MAG: DUF302 domain-containing protein [Thermodesulfobacteriota bacterium]
MLPCNVVVQEVSDEQTEVAAIDPVAAMKAVDNPEVAEIAMQVRLKLRNVIDNL